MWLFLVVCGLNLNLHLNSGVMPFQFNRKYRIRFLGLLTFLTIVMVMIVGPIPQSILYHNFADERSLFGIPNFANVFSNLPFVLIGLFGFSLVKASTASPGLRTIYACMFIGILLIGLGSAYYHYQPDNYRLVFDRLPMTIVFMSLLSATLSESIDAKIGRLLLFPLLILGIAAVGWWHYTEQQGDGDLRAYVLVQYYPLVFIPLILVLFPSPSRDRGVRQLVWVVIWYLLAKLFEQLDRPIFYATGFISGHTLKHLAAALATWHLIRMFQVRYVLDKTEK
jgi:hypothetical protein